MMIHHFRLGRDLATIRVLFFHHTLAFSTSIPLANVPSSFLPGSVSGRRLSQIIINRKNKWSLLSTRRLGVYFYTERRLCRRPPSLIQRRVHITARKYHKNLVTSLHDGV